MRKLKKIFAIFLSLVMVFSFAACSKTEDTSVTEETETVEETVETSTDTIDEVSTEVAE